MTAHEVAWSIDQARQARVSMMQRLAAHPSPLLLCTTAHPSLMQHAHPSLGRLVQPRHFSSIERTAGEGVPWAADNDCFQGLDAPRFYAMLDRLQGVHGCLFVTVPDVVGDAVATAKQFETWSVGVERRGLPMALVLQDGVENLLDWYGYNFHRLAAVFIGGSTEWKLGPEARAFAQHAAAHGKWVHWGRVNSRKRFDYITSTGAAHSFDGSSFARWRKTYLNEGLAWTDELRLEGVA